MQVELCERLGLRDIFWFQVTLWFYLVGESNDLDSSKSLDLIEAWVFEGHYCVE